MVHRDLEGPVEGTSPEWLWLFLPSPNPPPPLRHSFPNPLMRAVLGSRETLVLGLRTLSVFLPISPGFPGRYADSADKERAGLRQVSFYSESLVPRPQLVLRTPFLAIFSPRVVQ